MGIYKVTGGQLKQSFQYQASSYSVDYGSGECWEYHFNSQGDGSSDLKPVAKGKQKGVRGDVVKAVFDEGVFELRDLGWSGPVSRNTVYNMRVAPGERYSDECDPPDKQPPETFGCGSDRVDGYRTPELVAYTGGGIPILDNSSGPQHRLGLFGAMPEPLGLYPCSSESLYAGLFAGGAGAISNVKLKAFERFEKKINLRGKFDYNGPRGFFFAGFEKGSGSQIVSTRWSLDLKCVDRC